MTTKKAVCLISGGLDSCVTAFLAKKKGYELYALTVRYGQRHLKEITCAKKIAKAVGAKEHSIIDINLDQFGGSSLLKSSSQTIHHRSLKEIGKRIPSTYVPARNTIFLSLALAYAEARNADTIFIGVNALDYSGYPDCRPDYLNVFQKLATLATKCGVEGTSIRIEAPLLHDSKVTIIKKGIKLNVPFQYTWSCYQGDKKACGRCDSCLLRLHGFAEAGVMDPLAYDSVPGWYKKKD